jgi:hypothetical protein
MKAYDKKITIPVLDLSIDAVQRAEQAGNSGALILYALDQEQKFLMVVRVTSLEICIKKSQLPIVLRMSHEVELH